jgi:hypothetical protein
VRTSSDDYDLGQDNLDKIYVHLTNNAVQKFSENYGKFEDGNQISLQELSVYNKLLNKLVEQPRRVAYQSRPERRPNQGEYLELRQGTYHSVP